jgi:hypothetical protein
VRDRLERRERQREGDPDPQRSALQGGGRGLERGGRARADAQPCHQPGLPL